MPRHIPADLQSALEQTGGLTSAEAESRRLAFGANAILIENRHSWADIAKDTARDPMIWFLAATSVLFFAVGETAEGAVMATALLPILGMDAYLHRRTQASTASLSIELSPTASVIRNAAEVVVPTLDLVPGDRVVVRPGSSFPADGRLLAGDGVQVDESTLTGESIPVTKVVTSTRHDSVPDTSWVMAGTRLLTGEAVFQVVMTGAKTGYGEIVRTALLSIKSETQLQKAVNKLVFVLTLAAVALCMALGLITYWNGHGLFESVMSAITLAVAALPEEFPVVLSFLMGVGVYRMARQKALVRYAVAVENIGRVTCICTDKTGTITEGRLRVAMLSPAQGAHEDQLESCAAHATREDSGDPLDAALLQMTTGSSSPIVAVFPFTEERRRETVIRKTATGGFIVAVKGAPETVLSCCELTQRSEWNALTNAQQLAGEGYKVIAFAQKSPRRKPSEEPMSGFLFQGFVAFEDPVRPEVPDAIDWATAHGIKVIMVTGDHAATARVIALKAGIGGKSPRIVSGDELATLLAHEDPRKFDVVARAKPIQKLDLVRALQRRGESVVVTGDGVNDVPALSGADVGVAMGQRGAQPARETAAIVLLNDSFTTIATAIRQGRQIFWSLRLSFAYLLLVHISLVLAAALIPLLGYPLLFVPIHIVLLELIMHPTAILGFHGGNDMANGRSAKVQSRTILTRRDAILIGFGGLWLAASILGAYVYALGANGDTAHSRGLGFSVLVLGSSFAVAVLTRFRNTTSRVLAIAPVVATVFAIQIRDVATWLQFSPLHISDWLLATVLALPILVVAHHFVRNGAARGTAVADSVP
jgi:P-type Ca2+ transporter type 2C